MLNQEEDLKNLSKQFLAFYKNISTGYNQFTSDDKNFDLILIVSDITEIIKSFHAKIDVWYLDGFSPSKNPEMWSKEIFSFIKKNSKKGASFSTYTTAGFVREGLAGAGFSVEKIKGFGNKKHMLKGILPITLQKLSNKPWFRIPTFVSNKKQAIIIGGGIAGTSVAYALAIKGYSITLVERESKIAPGASGNPAGMFSPLLTGDPSDLSEWNSVAYKEFTQFLDSNPDQFSNLFKKTGVFQTTKSQEEVKRLKKALNNSKLGSSDFSFLEEGNSIFTQSAGIFFPYAGWINPFLLAQVYLKLASPNPRQILSTSMIRLEREKSHWKVFLSNNEILESEIVILANSFEAKDFVTGIDRIKKVRGQILYYPSNQFPIQINSTILHEDGYIIPNVNGIHIIGSTFDPHDSSQELNEEHNVYLLQKLKTLIPKINPLDGKKMQGRVSFRAMSSDHLPIVGPVPDTNQFQKVYEDLWKSNIYKDYEDGKYLPGLYVTTAHGSKGILNSYLASIILASMVTDDPSPVSSNMLERINPSRFLIQSFINKPNLKNMNSM